MELKTHHKWIIGSFSTIIIVFMITSGFLMYLLFVKVESNFNNLNGKIDNLNADTQEKIGELTDSLIQTNEVIEQKVGSINKELVQLKASVGEDFSGVIDSVIKSVVTIKTDSAQGTGFIISDDGYVVTNAHVLADQNGYLASNIRAITYDSGTKSAQFMGFDSTLDIALLKIPGSYNAISLADSNSVKVGQKVAAIGNPLDFNFRQRREVFQQ